ncbi:Hypothetical protein SRAE_X000239800 [Strongyloides ratti]|uniref:Uncharacterized protein n=1 Tax=Strongyloides ratti TaxID=34506 RepID=A0A090KT43_STRRB|nr:Hypothetical protein SRAE_X000239800 [Strongyloides ratti]CEF60665.1 Hypothetical protein SRAE_X000239800 [Strongyloides ratti]
MDKNVPSTKKTPIKVELPSTSLDAVERMGLQSRQNFPQPLWMLWKEKDFNKENSNQNFPQPIWMLWKEWDSNSIRTSFNLSGCCGKKRTSTKKTPIQSELP